MRDLMKDHRGSESWGRWSAAACLVMACALAWAGKSESLVSTFLLAAFGAYGTSKTTEAIVGVAAPPVTGTGQPQEPLGAGDAKIEAGGAE
jgi:hypothetical protein